ncbi:DUF6461 domain-containing protein [Planomonospora venezuelensis]|uniref:Uncharacterized protein n=1 Tax=Planomonospora venezuelensis TaxID=1999 RepID=A0A841CZM4_PLAVE|nr:DUF6461 domain-containing protein [Planomonospora venezuelensis]MBB5961395.1 hypothetical protein [Planomonospora venezuelensis]GIN01862.1 hypothetical protein Pve01_35200 [Planomonospora venezuelensis]
MEISYADVVWLTGDYGLGDLWCLTFVRGLDEAEALRRAGAEERSIRPLTYEELIDEGLFPDTLLAGRLGDWAVLIEESGWEALDALEVLSVGTEAVSVLRHDYAADRFEYAVDGGQVTSFNLMIPACRHGSDPDRLVSLMREAGVDPAYAPGSESNKGRAVERPTVGGTLMLVARLTGVMLTQEVLNGPLLGGDVGARRVQD